MLFLRQICRGLLEQDCSREQSRKLIKEQVQVENGNHREQILTALFTVDRKHWARCIWYNVNSINLTDLMHSAISVYQYCMLD